MLPSARTLACRVVLIGDSSVGKTCILNRFIDDSFRDSELNTVGANYQVYRELFDGRIVEIQIWDTAGQERFRSLSPIYYRSAAGAISVFDVTNSETYFHLSDWISAFTAIAGSNTVIAVAANKIDFGDQNQELISQAREMARQSNYIFEETSARSGSGIRPLFDAFFKAVVRSEGRKRPQLEAMQIDHESHSSCSC
jgi:small GTP-binding protein